MILYPKLAVIRWGVGGDHEALLIRPGGYPFPSCNKMGCDHEALLIRPGGYPFPSCNKVGCDHEALLIRPGGYPFPYKGFTVNL